MKKLNIAEVTSFIEAQSPETKIYIGADSERYKRGNLWYADYTLAVVVHIDGCHGCKIFGEVQTEIDYDAKNLRSDRDRIRAGRSISSCPSPAPKTR